MSIGGIGSPIGYPLGLIEAAAGTTTVLSAAGGTFALTGEAATFQIELAVSFGGFALAGEAAAFQDQFVAASGSFTLTGEAQAFEPQFSAACGSFALVGEVANLYDRRVTGGSASATRSNLAGRRAHRAAAKEAAMVSSTCAKIAADI
jgi:hypothetical protein